MLVNVHLSPFIARKDSTFSQIFASIDRTEDIHTQEIETILQIVDHLEPTIIAGDFNSISSMIAPTTLKSAGMVDAHEALSEDADLEPTWYWPTRPVPLQLRIDYIFHTNHFKATAFEIKRLAGSDHSMLISRLKLGEQSVAPKTRK